MNQMKIIGLPVPVSERGHRIVLDRYMRSLYGLPENGSVLMEYTPDGWIRILPQGDNPSSLCIKKSISAGRFNLPKDWTGSNRISIGEVVFLVMTDVGILISPGGIEIS